MTSSEQLCWIGLGNMGRGMAANLAKSGKLDPIKPLVVYNRTRSRSDAFKQNNSPVEVAESVEAAIRDATVVFTSLGNDEAVRAAYDKIVESGKVAGKIFVETSTILPETTEALAKQVASLGGEFVASPVFGAPEMAVAGKLVAVLAGHAAAIDRIRPFYDGVMSRATIDLCNQSPGMATLLKITGNTFILSMVETLSEGLVFAEKFGLGAENLHKFIEQMMPAPFAAYSHRMLTADYMRDEPLFSVPLALKDARHALNLSSACGVDMKITKVVENHLVTLEDKRGPKGDLPAVYGVVREESGLKFDCREEEGQSGVQ